jgi:hypothetical protein
MAVKGDSAMVMFTGKGNGMPFEKLEEKVISWGGMKYGEKYAKALWRNELVVLKDLNLEDDLDKYKFDEHCSLVNDVIACDSPKYAASLLKDKRFSTLKWQVDCRFRLREKLFCHLESLCSEEAKRQLLKRGVNQMATMRELLISSGDSELGSPNQWQKGKLLTSLGCQTLMANFSRHVATWKIN